MTGDWIVEGYAPRVLAATARPSVGLAVWHRDVPPAVADWLDRLPPERLPRGRLLLAPEDLELALRYLFRRAGTPGDEEAAWLAGDLAARARDYALLAGSALLDLRIEALDGDGCWRFHRDAVAIRMLVTYRGPGTEWVAAAEAERALSQQRAYDGASSRLPRFAVALFKGSDAGAAGVVHRSPPITGSGETRLLLCLNVPSAASPRRWHPTRA